MNYYGIEIKDKVTYQGFIYTVTARLKNDMLLLDDGRKVNAKEVVKVAN